jgi:hypothetical protein
MPRNKHVRITIGVDGSCRIDAVRFTDASCQFATQEITNALGGAVVREHIKPEARVAQRCGRIDKERAR